MVPVTIWHPYAAKARALQLQEHRNKQESAIVLSSAKEEFLYVPEAVTTKRKCSHVVLVDGTWLLPSS